MPRLGTIRKTLGQLIVIPKKKFCESILKKKKRMKMKKEIEGMK